jgi:hypothetical protein
MKKILLIFLVCYCSIQSIGQIVINPKGTKILIDSSKWKITGNDIFFKNSGNVGIGTNTPSAQLHTTSGVRFQGIGTNIIDTKILTADASGNITTRSLFSLPTNIDSTSANNGLNLIGKEVRLGGNLIQTTTIINNANPLTFATGGAPFNITGLTAGATTDSLVTVNTNTGKINRINLSTFNKRDSTTASNGLNLVGKDVRLGGNLTQATTITNNANPLTIATGGTAFNITGLTAGTATDSLLTVSAAGKVNKVNRNILNRPDSTTSSNGLNLVGKDVRLGGNLTQATTITNNANQLTIATGGTAFNITGLTAGAATDSLLTVSAAGKVNKVNRNILNRPDSTTSSNGLNLVGKDVRLGGNLTQATTITNNANPLTIATGGTAFNITGLTAGAATDSLLTVSAAGKVNKVNRNILNKSDSTTSSNGLNLVGKDVRLGGNLTQATTITNNANPFTIATGGTALNITGLTAGAATDSLVTVNTTTGKINRINASTLNKVDSTTTSNGLNLVGKDVRLGGNLTQATTITNNANSLTIATGGTALNITGLTAGATTDSLVTVNTTTGKINRINLSLLNKVDSTTTSNGLNLVGKDVRLGGNLTQATTIATGGNDFNITGLTAGAATDSLVTVNTTTGKINRINLSSLNKVDSTTTSNGLNLVGKDVRLGGNLTQATTIATGGNDFNITGLTSGAATDSLVTVNTITGKINRINLSSLNKVDSTTTSNGLNLVGKDVRLGGNLNQATTIATGGNDFNITGLTAGAATDSLVTVNTTTGKINRINLSSLNKVDSTTTSNGLNLVGKDVRLGGNLTQATTIATGGNDFNITGLTSGAATDSLVTVNTITGKINRINLSSLNKVDSTTTSNGLNLVGKDVRLGGNLTQATTIATGGNDFNITGLTAGAATDSLVTVNTTTGKINRINLSSLNKVDSTTTSNGLNLVGKDVRLGGNLTQATTITNNANPLTIATGGTALNITGLTAGAATDSLVTVNTTTGKINRINLSLLNKVDSTTTSNGLNLVGKDVRLGGNLTQATTIATGGNDFNITGLTAGAATDSLVTVNTTTGKINRINLSSLNKVDSTTTSNGLNLVGKDVRLGGNLTQATTITNNANPFTIATGGTALNITGLTAGAATDSLVTVNTTTGKINRINLSSLNKVDSTTSSNGLNLIGKDVRLGGNLTQATTITNNANPLTIATGGNDFNITGLTAGAATDSLVTVNTTTGKINRINLSSLNKVDSTTTSNGLNLVGKDVRLGGNLTQATTIATGGNDFNITGLTAGAATDSLVTVNTTTGKINRINLSSLNKVDSTTTSNGLNLVGKDVRLGGNLIQATTIATGGNDFNITGLTSGATTDSLVTVNTTTGKINRINISTLNKIDSTTTSNGLNLVGKDVRLGGNLIQATTIATGGNDFNITGLTSGATTDSLVTVNTTTGKINRINLSSLNKVDSTTTSNGLNLVGKDVRLGGNLTQATTITNNANPLTIATGGMALNITGLTAGAATDSLVTVNTTTGKINRINISTLNKIDSTTSDNGLTLTGKNVQLGGNLTQATTITNNANPLTIATGGTALNITGLTAGAATDSLVTVNTTTGKINRINLSSLNKIDSTTSNNGLTLTGKNVQLGGNLTQATTITNNANPLTIATGGTALNITGLTSGAATDSLVTVNTTTGKINRINVSSLNKVDSTTTSNGLNLVGKDVRLGGNLTQATTITNNANPLTIATGGTALNITGLTAGAATDSLVTVNTTTGKINRINVSSLNKVDSTTTSNGLNLVGKDVRLGGNLTQATTIATGGNDFNITGLTAGAATDSLVTVNTATGKINRINLSSLNKVDSTTTSNGLNLVGKDVRLGGNLTQATTITNNANPLTIATGGTALNITGLTSGAATDSLVTVNTTTGKINRINVSSLNKVDSTTTSNGLNLVGKDVRLGGNLTQATTITNNANPLTIATGGTALNITGLPSGASTDSLVVVNNTTGQLRKIVNTQPSVIEIFDALGTQTLSNTFSNLNFGSINIADAGYTSTAGVIAIANAGLYRITLRVSVKVTNNTSSGGEFQLTNAGGVIFGTNGYTFQRNADNSNGTVTIVKMVNLNAGSTIAAQGRRYSANGNLTLIPNGSSLLIEKIR